MSDISIRTEGRAGRITLTRPKALNAMSHQMGLDIEAALNIWETDDAVEIVLIDAEGEKAFAPAATSRRSTTRASKATSPPPVSSGAMSIA